MPIYEYISESPDDPDLSCTICRKGFELQRSIERHALAACPLCRNVVRKKISQINTPKITKPFSDSDAKKAGFTVLEKRCDGSYEKM